MRRAFALAAFVGCASAAPHEPARGATSSHAPAPAKPRDARVERAMHEMSRERELAIVRDVDGRVVSRDELMRELRAHVAREVPRAEIENERAFLATLGVLAADEDYEGEVYAAIRLGAGGMYLPESGAMLLPDDLDEMELATSLAHEAVHALQDQHFGLEKRERWVAGAGDAMLAWSCLAEGDATSATGEHPEPSSAKYVLRELAAPYVYGTAFVDALRARGGWDAVNRAWARPTLTTEQVLHPEKWERDEHAEAVAEPALHGFARVEADVHGELGLRLVLESGVPAARAAAGASGWAGDTAVLARAEGGYALAWRVRYDDEASAERGREVMSEALAAGRTCRADRANPTSVARLRRDVLLLVGPRGSSCALLDAWTKEVLAPAALH